MEVHIKSSPNQNKKSFGKSDNYVLWFNETCKGKFTMEISGGRKLLFDESGKKISRKKFIDYCRGVYEEKIPGMQFPRYHDILGLAIETFAIKKLNLTEFL